MTWRPQGAPDQCLHLRSIRRFSTPLELSEDRTFSQPYDLYTASRDWAAARTIVNVSSRVTLGTGEMVTPGFVVLGTSKKLLIRAVGPKLADL